MLHHRSNAKSALVQISERYSRISIFALLTLPWQLSRVRNSLSYTRGYARTPSCINLSQPWSPPCYSTEYNLGTVLHRIHPTVSWVFERSHMVVILNITLWFTSSGKCGSLPCYSGYWWYLGQCRRRLRIRRRFGTVRNSKHDVTVIFTFMCLRSASNRYSPKSFLRLMLWCKWCSFVLFGWYQIFCELACTKISHWFIHFHSYNQKVHDHISKLSLLLARLSTANEGHSPKVIIIHAIPHPEDRSYWLGGWLGWETFLDEGRKCKLGLTSEGEIEWKRLPFDAPLWILFSSGTTGKPKCVILQRNTYLQDTNSSRPIVHRAGGMLIQAKKEFIICGDLRSEDVFFYYTTTFVVSYLDSQKGYLSFPTGVGWCGTFLSADYVQEALLSCTMAIPCVIQACCGTSSMTLAYLSLGLVPNTFISFRWVFPWRLNFILNSAPKTYKRVLLLGTSRRFTNHENITISVLSVKSILLAPRCPRSFSTSCMNISAPMYYLVLLQVNCPSHYMA